MSAVIVSTPDTVPITVTVPKVAVTVRTTGPQGVPGPAGPSGATSNLQVTHPNTDDVLVQQWDAGKARWQTVHYDSGIREVKAALLTANGFTSVGGLRLRRVGGTVLLSVINLQRATAGTGDLTFYNLPSGFRPTNLSAIYYRSGQSNLFSMVTANGDCTIRNPATGDSLTAVWLTSDAPPTTLPGTLIAPAPA